MTNHFTSGLTFVINNLNTSSRFFFCSCDLHGNIGDCAITNNLTDDTTSSTTARVPRNTITSVNLSHLTDSHVFFPHPARPVAGRRFVCCSVAVVTSAKIPTCIRVITSNLHIRGTKGNLLGLVAILDIDPKLLARTTRQTKRLVESNFLTLILSLLHDLSYNSPKSI